MKPIEQAILQQNIIDALNALFLSGQVGKVETKKTIIMEEQPLTADPENGYSALQIEYNVPVKLGKKYTVHLDSGSYIAELREIPGVGGYLGNGSLVGDLEDTGESYCIFSMLEEGTVFTIAVDTNLGKKISITETTETIHPIDPKFLPGVCLPVVELSGTLTTGDAVAEEDCAKLKAAHGSNLPVVIKSDAIINNTKYVDSALIYNSGTMPDNGVMFFVASLGAIQLQILSNDDGETWNAYAIS